MHMIVYGYAKSYYYDTNGCLYIRVRIPSIHGAYKQADYKGKQVKNYVIDENLPYYQSVILPRMPADGDVVALTSTSEGKGSDFMVVGLTGAKYNDGVKDISSTK